MKRNIFMFLGIIAIAVVIGFTLAGCESVGEALFTGTTNYVGATTEQGMIYTFYNNSSSYSVTLSDDTGSHTLAPGDNFSARFNRSASIYNVDYSPIGQVSVSQSGSTFTFRNK
jgi:hypothetical protein